MADHNSHVVINVKQGEDFSARVEWFDDDGLPFKLQTTAAKQTSRMDVRNGMGDWIFTFYGDKSYGYDEDGNKLDNPEMDDRYQGYIYTYEKGEFHLFIPWHVSWNIPAGSYVFDMFADVVLDGNNAFKPNKDDYQRRCVMSGQFIVRPKVTLLA